MLQGDAERRFTPRRMLRNAFCMPLGRKIFHFISSSSSRTTRTDVEVRPALRAGRLCIDARGAICLACEGKLCALLANGVLGVLFQPFVRCLCRDNVVGREEVQRPFSHHREAVAGQRQHVGA